MSKAWFAVDKAGLARVLERRGKGLIVGELVQNAWDEPGVTEVRLTIERAPGTKQVTLTVEDDAPDGFHDLAHAYTLFAPSKKVADPTLRGRFNLGDKLVLALASEAELVSTKGGWRFDAKGRHTLRRKRERGSQLTLKLPLTAAAQETVESFAARLIPPGHIATYFQGRRLESPAPIRVLRPALKTEEADEQGVLRERYRVTELRLFKARDPEGGWLHEMGIPVVQTRDYFDVDIGQKVPLGLDRTNVTPGYLSDIRAEILNGAHDLLDSEQANSPWVRDALAYSTIRPDAVTAMWKKRFSEKAVIYDPSDHEANKLAASKGYVVVHGSQLSESEWSNVRNAGCALPAGQVTPSRPDGYAPTEFIQRADWTPDMAKQAARVRFLGRRLMHRTLEVAYVRAPTAATIADYNKEAGRIRFNLGRLGEAWPAHGLDEDCLDLLLHEFGHEYSGDHLSSAYHEALTRLGARLAILLAGRPNALTEELPC